MVRGKVFSKVQKSWNIYFSEQNYHTAVLIPLKARQNMTGRCDLSDVFPRLKRQYLI